MKILCSALLRAGTKHATKLLKWVNVLNLRPNNSLLAIILIIKYKEKITVLCLAAQLKKVEVTLKKRMFYILKNS